MGNGGSASPGNWADWVGLAACPAVSPFLASWGGQGSCRAAHGLRAHSALAEGGGGWWPGSGSASARLRRRFHERCARHRRARPLETRAEIRAAPELGVEDTATRLFRAEDPSPRTSLAAMATYLLGFFLRNWTPLPLAAPGEGLEDPIPRREPGL